MKHKPFFILGAADPEMQAIENLLGELEFPSLPAMIPEGEGRDRRFLRVRSSQAYQEAVQPGQSYVLNAEINHVSVVYLVECAVDPARLLGLDVCRVDHHGPGDPGYGWPPGMYWGASSIGQVLQVPQVAMRVQERGILRPDYLRDLQLIAAADHCPAAAYQGQCPGIDVERLRRWRIQNRAEYQRRSYQAILADVEAAEQAILRAPQVYPWVVDLRDHPPIPELPEAALRTGFAVLYRLDSRRGRVKEGIIGAGRGTTAGEAPVERFMAEAESEGLTEVYGNPVRGYAGGYRAV